MTKANHRTQKIYAAIIAFSLCCGLALPAGSKARSARASDPLKEVFDLSELGELIEAPADATVYVSLGELGSAVLASGAKVRLMTMPAPTSSAAADSSIPSSAHSVLAATVISGDLIVKLQPQARPLIRVGETVFSAARGSLFQAGWRNGSLARLHCLLGTCADGDCRLV